MKTTYAYPEIDERPDTGTFDDSDDDGGLLAADETVLSEWDSAFPFRGPTDRDLDAMAASFTGRDVPCCLFCHEPTNGEEFHFDCERAELYALDLLPGDDL